MTLIPPRRDDDVTPGAKPTMRFANFMEDSTTDINDSALKFPPIRVPEDDSETDDDLTYTFTLDDANNIVLKNAGTAGQKYVLPRFVDVAYAVGTFIEIYNDTTVDLLVGPKDSGDLLEDTTAGLTTGSRTIGAGGWARLRLINIDSEIDADTGNQQMTWKMTGDQIT